MKVNFPLYILKMHTAAQYESAAFIIKSYSFALYTMLNNFSREDRKQAEIIYNDNIYDNDVNGLHYVNAPLPIVYIDEDKDNALDILKTFEDIESEVYNICKKLELEIFAEISDYRLSILEEAMMCVEKEILFASRYVQLWKCGVCGAYSKTNEIPTECHLCGSKYGSYVKHYKIGG